jgi:ABC-type oligopeptide transport system ATPase subunit
MKRSHFDVKDTGQPRKRFNVNAPRDIQTMCMNLFVNDNKEQKHESKQSIATIDKPWQLFSSHFLNFKATIDAHLLPLKTVENILNMLETKVMQLVTNYVDVETFFALNMSVSNLSDIDAKLHEYMVALAAITSKLSQYDKINDDTEETQLTKAKVIHVVRCFKWCFDQLRLKLRQHVLGKGPGQFTDEDLMLFEYHIPNEDDFTPFQKLIISLGKEFSIQNYRKYNEQGYKEIQIVEVKDKNGNYKYMKRSEYNSKYNNIYTVIRVFDSHAWEPIFEENNTICKLVHHYCSKEIYFQRWRWLTLSSDHKIVKYLQNCRSSEFPPLKRDRNCRSFFNGVVHFTESAIPNFYNFLEKQTPNRMVSCKFFEMEFDPNFIYGFRHYWNVPTPTFDSILEYQNFNPMVKNIIYAVLGRTFYCVNTLDRWEIIPFFKGVAGSGKSTIGNTLMKFYQKEDVAILSSNVEEKFGLDAIADKMLFVCLEVTKSFKLPKADLQSIITGERVSIAGKHKKARTIQWKTPGILLGNELGPWVDLAGSLSRRLLVIEMLRRVVDVDTEMDQKLNRELPALLHKFHQAYHAMLDKCAGKGLWQMLPAYFLKVRQKIAIQTHPIKAFIHDENWVTYRPGNERHQMALNVFMDQFKMFLTNCGTKRHFFSMTDIEDALQQERLELRHVETKSRNGNVSGNKIIFGLSLGMNETKEEKEEHEEKQKHNEEMQIIAQEQIKCTMAYRISQLLTKCDQNPYLNDENIVTLYYEYSDDESEDVSDDEEEEEEDNLMLMPTVQVTNLQNIPMTELGRAVEILF